MSLPKTKVLGLLYMGLHKRNMLYSIRVR